MTLEAAETTIEPAKVDDGWEWAILEVFGHRRHVGRAREEERFGAKMLRIDVPKYPAARTLFDAAEQVPEATIVWTTHYYSGSAIFSFTLTDEDAVRQANTPHAPPYRARLPAPERDDWDHDPESATDQRDYDHG